MTLVIRPHFPKRITLSSEVEAQLMHQTLDAPETEHQVLLPMVLLPTTPKSFTPNQVLLPKFYSQWKYFRPRILSTCEITNHYEVISQDKVCIFDTLSDICCLPLCPRESFIQQQDNHYFLLLLPLLPRKTRNSCENQICLSCLAQNWL